MNNFKPSLISAALISSGFAFGISPAMAQEQSADELDVEVIQVTGIRGSLQRAQAIKMSSNSIVEAISAEDIGKLPDTSVAESLARLPGLAGERRNGRTSGLSVRGFNENYIGTTLNGRELLGTGDNRGVEFDLYPTEIIANIVVSKTPEAGMTIQGIGGVVDLQTISPLGKDRILAFNADYEQNEVSAHNPDFDNDGHRFSFNYVDSFFDDTLGVALVVASLETPRQEEQFRGWGYATVNTTPQGEDGANPRRATDTVDVPAGTAILGGHDSFARSALLERDSIAAVVQWAPTDKLMVQLDALYIDFEENDARRGLEEGLAEWGTSAYNITGVSDGLATSAFSDGFHSVIRNDAQRQDSDLKTFGLNLEYSINDDWSVEVDYSTGKVNKTITDIESYAGVGRSGIDGRPLSPRAWQQSANGAIFSQHPTLGAGPDLTDAAAITLAGPQAWGGNLSPISGFDIGDFNASNAQDGFVNQPIFEEDLDTTRLQINGTVEWGIISGIEAGVIYADRFKSKRNTGAFLTAQNFFDGTADSTVAQVGHLGTVSLDFIGIPGVVAYDSLGLLDSGFYRRTDAALVENGRLGDSYTISEELLTTYVKLDIDSEIGDVFVRGNLGVQIIDAEQSATGFSTTSNAQGLTNSVPVSGGADYTDVLPSLNLSFELTESQFIRTSLAKVQSRPRLDDLRPNSQVQFQFNDGVIVQTSPQAGPWSASGGNPELRPLEAEQFDLSYENYFTDDGYFAVSFFYKDLTNWHRNGAAIRDFSDVYIPSFHRTSDDFDANGDGIADGPLAPGTLEGTASFRVDGLTGFVRGYELQASVPLRVFSDVLDGFGLVASATFLDGELDVEEDSGLDNRVPGLSEEVYSLTAYYEYKGFEFRVSGTKRDDFLTEERGLSLALVNATDEGIEQWDAQIGYDFSESGIESLKGLRVTLKAQNITDEPSIRTNGSGDSRQIVRHQSFGANYLLGINYKF